jgi:hypothetical protein
MLILLPLFAGAISMQYPVSNRRWLTPSPFSASTRSRPMFWVASRWV